MTKKVGVKGITCTLLATFLFLSVGPSLVVAQPQGSVCFYSSPWYCQGSSSCCANNLVSGVCCKNGYSPAYGLSADVTPPSGQSFIYGDWSCFGEYGRSYGYFCWRGRCLNNFNSGKWLATGGHAGAEPGSEKPCNETVSPDTLQYTFITEDRRRASWVLPMASLTETDSNGPLLDLPAEEQVIWFKSRGATLKVEDHQTTPVPDYNAYSPAAGLTLPHPLAETPLMCSAGPGTNMFSAHFHRFS